MRITPKDITSRPSAPPSASQPTTGSSFAVPRSALASSSTQPDPTRPDPDHDRTRHNTTQHAPVSAAAHTHTHTHRACVCIVTSASASACLRCVLVNRAQWRAKRCPTWSGRSDGVGACWCLEPNPLLLEEERNVEQARLNRLPKQALPPATVLYRCPLLRCLAGLLPTAAPFPACRQDPTPTPTPTLPPALIPHFDPVRATCAPKQRPDKALSQAKKPSILPSTSQTPSLHAPGHIPLPLSATPCESSPVPSPATGPPS